MYVCAFAYPIFYGIHPVNFEKITIEKILAILDIFCLFLLRRVGEKLHTELRR